MWFLESTHTSFHQTIRGSWTGSVQNSWNLDAMLVCTSFERLGVAQCKMEVNSKTADHMQVLFCYYRYLF